MIPTQEVIHSQEHSIRELLKAVRDQSNQLNLQRVKIKSLEEKVNCSKWQCFGENSKNSRDCLVVSRTIHE